jgi:hypothetical protein
MGLFQGIVDVLAHRMGVPDEALRMFRASRRFSGFDKSTLPTELVPMNVRQLARGVLNFSMLQVLEDWVLPFWVVQQFDPRGPSFTPRSHTGVFMNVTHRDWTGIGNPDCPIEPIVDPRGLLTPFRDGWSIDVWLHVDGETFFPSRADDVHQCLVEGVPIVRTSWSHHGVQVAVTAWTCDGVLFQEVQLKNENPGGSRCRLGIAIRPFNPEGVALLHTIADEGGSLRIGKEAILRLSDRPTLVSGSTWEGGDCAQRFGSIRAEESRPDVRCPQGLASAVAAYDLDLPPGEPRTISCSCVLTPGLPPTAEQSDVTAVAREWESLLQEGARFATPDPLWNSHIRASLSTLLMLCDHESITPGPCTYHLFWFRDAAYMLSALDRFGYHSRTAAVIRSFAGRQDRDGYFRSQTGEWDSNGQALWSVWQHSILSGDTSVARELMSRLRKGVDWIEGTRRKRGRPPEAAGLLPPGLSAEHLGVSDHYFWDNFWALAGIDAYARLCACLGLESERAAGERLFTGFRSDLTKALVASLTRDGGYPAGPNRSFDHGAVGTVCAIYPLQLLNAEDPHALVSLDQLVLRYCHKDLFFQHFIHSGVNPYLTLQIAHGYLYRGERLKFLRHVDAVLRRASPTLTFPEALHPGSGGGSMGDGHHGWAAAELLSAFRDALAFEQWTPGNDSPAMILLGGLPADWFEEGKRFSASNAPFAGGVLSMTVDSFKQHVRIALRVEERGCVAPVTWQLRLPFACTGIESNGRFGSSQVANETWIDLGARWTDVEVIVSR